MLYWHHRYFVVTTDTPSSEPFLTLSQYASSDDRWGIHSSVWDGGIALSSYLLREQATRLQDGRNLVVIDLGSGTGIVGLAISKARRFSAAKRVFLTDIAEALPLLEKNLELNRNATENEDCCCCAEFCQVKELEWGRNEVFEDGNSWIHQVKRQMRTEGTKSTVWLTGADIVYRVSLFRLLLMTIVQLFELLQDDGLNAQIECVLACQSIRTHLKEFWKMASSSDFGFTCRLIAIVDLPSFPIDQIRLGDASILRSDERLTLENAPVRAGCIWIVKLSRTTT